jgi:hypothetical protein
VGRVVPVAKSILLDERKFAMNAPVRRVWERIVHLPLLDFLARRETIPQPPEATDDGAFRFKGCEEDCGPSAEAIEATEHERAEQFKRDQLLPVMGWPTGALG